MARRGSRGGRRRRRESEGERNERAYRASVDLLQSISGWGGAGGSSRRGYIYWPGLDTQRELDAYSRTELLRKARWMRANMGLPRRICGGLADFIGYLKPQWNSGDPEWDEAAAALWADRAESPMVVDAAGTFGIDELQIQLDRCALGDGDVLPVVVEGRTGGAMVALYEAHQLANPPGADASWIDGVRVNKFRRHVQYGVQGAERVRRISARDAMWYGHPDAAGRIRPPTVLAAAINHLHDVAEIVADWKMCIKVAAQWGLYLRNQKPGAAGWGPRAVFSGLRDDTARPPWKDRAPGDERETPATDGSEDKRVKIEDILRATGGVVDLPEGVDVGTVVDERPHPNAFNLLGWMVRDVCWGAGVAPEIVWDISGLRGANNRLQSADLGRWVGARLLRKRAWMRRFCSVWAAKEMRAGRLGEPAAGAEWYRVTFIPQASLTSDRGREGKLNLELVQANLRSLKTHFGEEGKNWVDEVRQMAGERRFVRELLGEVPE